MAASTVELGTPVSPLAQPKPYITIGAKERLTLTDAKLMSKHLVNVRLSVASIAAIEWREYQLW